MNEELKPCPLCGNTPQNYSQWSNSAYETCECGAGWVKGRNKSAYCWKQLSEKDCQIQEMQEGFTMMNKGLLETIAKLENKLAIKCEHHVDYGSNVEALIEEQKEKIASLESQVKELSQALSKLWRHPHMGLLYRDEIKESIEALLSQHKEEK